MCISEDSSTNREMPMNTTALPLRRRIGPALTLMFLAPLIAEVLPGATRISSLFVFPIEVCIWGGGALLIRESARRFGLGWLHMLLLALALALIEEFVVQQTSLAPMVVQIVPGEPFARAFGVNYVYLLWALGYEATFVVLVPIMLTELIFRSRREDPWLRLPGSIVVSVLFIGASFPAWYMWTQIARPHVFKVPVYHPPVATISIGMILIVLLVLISTGPLRSQFEAKRKPLAPLAPWALALCGFVAAAIWYGLVLLAFGIDPQFPPSVAVSAGLAVAATVVYLLPRFSAHPAWNDAHRMGVAFGTIVGAMSVSFAGFVYATLPLDLYGKILLNVLALAGLIALARRLRRGPA
jgi:hypothetical protein